MKKILMFFVIAGLVLKFAGCREEEIKEKIKATSWNDGTYFGESKTFPGADVKVTVTKGKISGIEVVKAGGNPDYYTKAVEKIPGEIIKKQSIKVDAVTGATKTSVCIMEAVESALSKAK
ncbi:MAG: FMN-binding protein [Elusimicrobia bacterium]|nr:FMN-binding protein [Elusimicrobiota bacterium]